MTPGSEQVRSLLHLDQMDLRLGPLRRPTAAAVKRMAESLCTYGQLSPAYVVSDGTRFVLVDGFTRHAAARSLGLASLVVTVGGQGLTQAKAMMYLLNRSRGFTVIEEALLIRDLVDADGLTQSEAGTLLQRHKSWVSRRLEILRALAAPIVEDLLLELLPFGSAASLARLPQQNQTDFAVVIQQQRLSPRQIAHLVDLWCKAPDPGMRQYLLDAPQEVLSKAARVSGQSWQDVCTLLVKIVARLDQRLSAAALSGDTLGACDQFLDQAQVGIAALRKRCVEAKA